MKGNAKCKNSSFEPLFGGLRGNAQGSPMARWKARCRLPISANWIFLANSHGCSTIKRNLSKSAWGGSFWARIFDWWGRRPQSVYGPLDRGMTYSYNFTVGSFHTKKICSRHFTTEVEIYWEKSKIYRVLCHPQTSRDTIQIFSPPKISVERLKLEPSNLVCMLIIASPSLRTTNCPWMGRGHCHVTSLIVWKISGYISKTVRDRLIVSINLNRKSYTSRLHQF